MQRPDRRVGKDDGSSEAKFLAVARICPECGSGNNRPSRLGDKSKSLIKLLLCNPYRCRACRVQFWVLNPWQLLLSAILVLALVSVPWLFWLYFDQQLHEKAAILQNTEVIEVTDYSINDTIKTLAEQGQVDEQYHFGMTLFKGVGVVQDYKAAFYWLEKAAGQGHAKAQLALGDMYFSGSGIKSDIERAYLWFTLAAAQGLDNAVVKRELVAKRLTPDQLAALQAEAAVISRGQHAAAEEASKDKASPSVPTPAPAVDTPDPSKK
jgi:hypothetical protein